MTDFLMPDLSADGLTGAIIAAEGVRNAAVLLNGPTGCKFYHGALSDAQFPRDSAMDPLQFSDEFYFGQPRVPATYLDGHDYVFGGTEKLEKILPKVAAKGHQLIAVVNSPGAALIGDDLERLIQRAGLTVPCVAIENTGFSDSFAAGFQQAALKILRRLELQQKPPDIGGVNLVGHSVFHRHWLGDAEELRRLLELCGVTVNAVICAGCTVAELEASGAAEVNVVVHHELADQLAPYLEASLQRPVLIPGECAPFGFLETEKWIQRVCQSVNADPAPAFADIRRSRRKAYDILNRFTSLTGLPRGATFALQADGSTALPMTRWLYNYLGMVPAAVWVQDATAVCTASLQCFLDEISCSRAWHPAMTDIRPDVVFGGEGFISRFRALGAPVVGIDIALPANGAVEVITRCHMGATGTLWLLERILNGMLAV